MTTACRWLMAWTAALVLAMPAFAAAPTPEPGSYGDWSRFKPGTSVTYRMTDHDSTISNTGGKTVRHDLTIVEEETVKLISVTAQKVVLERRVFAVVDGQKHEMTPERHEITRPRSRPKSSGSGVPTQEGFLRRVGRVNEKSIRIDGRVFKCAVVNLKSPKDSTGDALVCQVAVSAQVPGCMVRLCLGTAAETFTRRDLIACKIVR